MSNTNIVDVARFNGTRFLAIDVYNRMPGTARRTINGQHYILFNGQWTKVGFRRS